MSVNVTFDSPFLTNLFNKARCSTAGVTEKARTGMAAVSGKAGDTLAAAKLRRVIEDLEDEILFQMCSIGEMVYATHRGTPSDSDEMQKILEYLDDLHDEVEAHQRELMLLQGANFCEVCGAENGSDNAYCQDCGTPIPAQDSAKN